MKHRWLAVLATVALVAALFGAAVPTALASSGSPGDNTIVITINDSEAGGSYDQTFVKAYAGTTTSGTDVYVYVPEGAFTLDGDTSVPSLDPQWDPTPGDDFTPCADNTWQDYVITQAQVNELGDELVNQIVAVDEAHYGEIGLADESDSSSDALVMLVYNVQDSAYYDCSETTYTAGYFAPEYIDDAGMNVIVLDAYDWANRIGDQTDNADGVSHLYEGVIAHELEHLLMNYSDPGELSWVDEGLADFAIFLNAYPAGGSHITYQQVFHRETSLTRWGGGLENYGASFSFFLYLWEQAGGNGPGAGQYDPDQQYDGTAGDLLIKLIFEEQADGMQGVQNAIDTFNAMTGANLRSAEDLFKDWAVALYLDYEGSDTFDFRNLNFGDPTTTAWTIEIANDVFWGGRGQYTGAMPPARWAHNKNVPQQTALPFGVSYETFRNPGPTFQVSFSGEPTSEVAPHSGPTHWYAGFEAQTNNILNVDSPVSGGQTLDFWTWYFIEDGWDYGFVEALVGGEWVTVPLVDDAGNTVTTNTDPHDNNEEGNGLTGTSGGAYFVDDPVYIHLSAVLPNGTTDVRFRYSTDAAYMDTGWFVDDVNVDGAPATVSSEDWIETAGVQDNHWVVQVVSSCDLTPNVQGDEVQDAAGYIYRFEDDSFTANFSTKCMGSKDRFLVVVSNLPTGDLQYLDADYTFTLTNTGNKQK
jgi:Immune inhibitor A-like, MAM domain